MKTGLLKRLHQPEYTGENRCEACTVVNVIITAILGAVVARKSKFAAVVTVSVSSILIYLRGYLIPGTPTLTKRYLPPSVLRLFGKEPELTLSSGFGSVGTHQQKFVDNQTSESSRTNATSPKSATVDGDESGRDQSSEETVGPIIPENFFRKYNVIKPCEDIDDLCLTESFKNEWHDEINRIDLDSLKAEDAAVAVGLTIDEADFEIKQYGDGRALRRDNRHIGQWPSQAALVADVTAARVLENWIDEWESIPVDQKGTLLNGLRLFLETCPTTGGEVTTGEETVESCCQSYDVVAVTCEETGERLFEYQLSELEDNQNVRGI